MQYKKQNILCVNTMSSSKPQYITSCIAVKSKEDRATATGSTSTFWPGLWRWRVIAFQLRSLLLRFTFVARTRTIASRCMRGLNDVSWPAVRRRRRDRSGPSRSLVPPGSTTLDLARHGLRRDGRRPGWRAVRWRRSVAAGTDRSDSVVILRRLESAQPRSRSRSQSSSRAEYRSCHFVPFSHRSLFLLTVFIYAFTSLATKDFDVAYTSAG